MKGHTVPEQHVSVSSTGVQEKKIFRLTRKKHNPGKKNVKKNVK